MVKTEKGHGIEVYDFFQLMKHNSFLLCQERRQKNSQREGGCNGKNKTEK